MHKYSSHAEMKLRTKEWIKEEVPKLLAAKDFKTGQMVRIREDAGEKCKSGMGFLWDDCPGKEAMVGKICEIHSVDETHIAVWQPDRKIDWGFPFDAVELITKNSSMSNIIEKFRKLTLSKEDKLMTELGLENPAGTPTADGLQILQELLYAERRSDIIKKAELIKDEFEKDKK